MSQIDDDNVDRRNVGEAAPIAVDDDPLAELARLVNSGSVFGSIPQAETPTSEADTAPLQSGVEATDSTPQPSAMSMPLDPPEAQAPSLGEPSSEALQHQGEPSIDLDAALGAQLEAELVGEFFETHADPTPTEQEPEPQELASGPQELVPEQQKIMPEPEEQAQAKPEVTWAAQAPAEQVFTPEPTPAPVETSTNLSAVESFLRSEPVQAEPVHVESVQAEPSPSPSPAPPDPLHVSDDFSKPTQALTDEQASQIVLEDTAHLNLDIETALSDALRLDGLVDGDPVETTTQSADEPVLDSAPSVMASAPEAFSAKILVEEPVDDIGFEFDLPGFEAEIASATQADIQTSQPTTSASPSKHMAAPLAAKPKDQAPPQNTANAAGDESEGADPATMIEIDNFASNYDGDGKAHRRGIIAIAAVLLIAALGGAAAFFSGAFGPGSVEPVVIAADDGPVRVLPADPGGTETPNQNRTVFDTRDSESSQTDINSRLVERAEQPDIEGDPPQQTSTASNDTIRATQPPEGPRRVRTVVVRPDGTLVNSLDQEAAPSLPAPTPSTSASVDSANRLTQRIETQQRARSEAIDAAQNRVNEAVEPAQTTAETEIDSSAQDAVNALNNQIPQVPESGQVIARRADPPPLPRPNTGRTQTVVDDTQPLSLIPRTEEQQQQTQSAAARAVAAVEPAPVQPASAQPVTEAPQASNIASAAAPTPNSGDFMVQLSAQRSDAAARTDFNRLQQRYSVLTNYSLDVQRADLGAQGVYHRVRVGPFARNDANSLCERLKSQGGDCIVRRR